MDKCNVALVLQGAPLKGFEVILVGWHELATIEKMGVEGARCPALNKLKFVSEMSLVRGLN